MAPPLFLIGFMAAGKTSVGKALAGATGRRFVDLDDSLDTSLVGRDEPAFRRAEAEALRAQAADDLVIATGGGAAAHGDNLAWMRERGIVIALGVDVEDAKKRAEGGPPRPLLANADELYRRRASVYRQAHAVVDTTKKSIDDVAREVEIVERASRTYGKSTVVALGQRSYPVVVSWRFTVEPGLTVALSNSSRVAVITDTNVLPHARAFIEQQERFLLRSQELRFELIEIPPGEASKSFDSYRTICEELVARGFDRSSLIIAFGGGVVGDLAGFVAATFLRGIRVVQMPTTIVAMTDAAIGGKTAIDLPAGKNLVGAFHQPSIVVCNLSTLATLPITERRAGFGELWKYALLDGPDLWKRVDACAAWSAGTAEQPPELVDVIQRAIAYKAAIVGRDERETSGFRALLNLGHTVGHAIEAATGLLHGEAVGLGLIAACRISHSLGHPDLEAQITDALAESGLPTELDRYLTDPILARLTVDKKRVGNDLSFIVVREVGACEVVRLPTSDIPRILRRVTNA